MEVRIYVISTGSTREVARIQSAVGVRISVRNTRSKSEDVQMSLVAGVRLCANIKSNGEGARMNPVGVARQSVFTRSTAIVVKYAMGVSMEPSENGAINAPTGVRCCAPLAHWSPLLLSRNEVTNVPNVTLLWG